MERRALVIGSQVLGLTGVHGDVEVVADALAALGFGITTAIERDAALDPIIDRYQGLIDDTKPGDAAVVYYSGHGFRFPNVLSVDRPELPVFLQYLIPTDIGDRSDGRFRGLLAERLSLLQHQLTDKTDTTSLDCCHSARMSRDARQFPKAATTDAPPWSDVEAQWTEVHRAGAGLDLGYCNPDAVRLVACSPEQSYPAHLTSFATSPLGQSMIHWGNVNPETHPDFAAYSCNLRTVPHQFIQSSPHP